MSDRYELSRSEITWAEMLDVDLYEVDPDADLTVYCEICLGAEAHGMTNINDNPEGEWLATCVPCAAPYLPKRAPIFPRRYRNTGRGWRHAELR